MKYLTLSILLISSVSFSQVGINTINPNAILDVSSTTQGILIPRVALVLTTQELPITNPASGALVNGTLVYNTVTVNDVQPGFYYWKGTRWVPLISNLHEYDFASISLPSPSGTNEDVDFLLATSNFNSNIFRIVHSGAELGGITNGAHGRVIYIYNESATDLKILSHTNSTSVAANRFSTDGDLVIKPGNTAMAIYDGLYKNRWSVIKSD
ncbi:hypothetical protein [Flavivirga eckloniae]|nr:hypothetical protein [Flavivirga eckloniae]